MNNYQMPRYRVVLYTVTFLLIIQPLAFAKEEVSQKITPSALQSQLMGFADRFLGIVSGSTMKFSLKNPELSQVQRAYIERRKLEASAAAVRIAAGVNPETSLLDMIVLVTLLRYSTEVDFLPELSGMDGRILLTAYQRLEKDIWSIADDVLSKEQATELQDLIGDWQEDNKTMGLAIGVEYYHFSAFSENRRLSTLVDEGEPGWFLAKISKATKEIEHTRVLAERALYIAERQMTLMRWQVEQIFYDLAITQEFNGLLNSAIDMSQASQRMATILEKMPKMVSAESEVVIKIFMQEIDKERTLMITQLFNEIAAEREEIIDQASDEIAKKSFFAGVLLIIVFVISVLIAALIYTYISLKFKNNSANPV